MVIKDWKYEGGRIYTMKNILEVISKEMKIWNHIIKNRYLRRIFIEHNSKNVHYFCIEIFFYQK